MKPLFITSIDTGIGKTVVSAILTEKLQADYWKPIQSGDLHDSDTLKVQSLVSNSKTVFHPEAYRLTQPFSPHKSADLDGVQISLDQINLPDTLNRLVIEGAGGLMVPLNQNQYMVDLIKKFDAEVILVVRHYLGSINHTLLSLSLLNSLNIPVTRIIVNGPNDEYAEKAIRSYANNIEINTIAKTEVLDKDFIISQAKHISI
ncbi:Dethiobiotin synthetase [Arcticibacter svalbardensis MN12-7]|uniref:ATP-dependent dethiobiotin synthetase BioD n=1 Tax=Arcticibacter svalbardensis MN12-7 TaxID=1150600 RepID=R9GVC4_9SPHI|nr:dethiobiotin synthase [Arcticibacter svalbardensis]EOR95651.1 Dethiobiotin synthetase [Arcticibacter svalbardensis MN12-7]